jgi:hypothetical protein
MDKNLALSFIEFGSELVADAYTRVFGTTNLIRIIFFKAGPYQFMITAIIREYRTEDFNPDYSSCIKGFFLFLVVFMFSCHIS